MLNYPSGTINWSQEDILLRLQRQVHHGLGLLDPRGDDSLDMQKFVKQFLLVIRYPSDLISSRTLHRKYYYVVRGAFKRRSPCDLAAFLVRLAS